MNAAVLFKTAHSYINGIKKSAIKLQLILLTVLIVFGRNVHATAPGGVSQGLGLWLKADQGISKTTSVTFNYVTGWTDQAGLNALVVYANNNPLSIISISNFPNWIDNSINFNPVVNFNGFSYFNGNQTINNVTEVFGVVKLVNNSGINISGAILGVPANVSGNYFFHTEGGAFYSGNTGNYMATNAFGNNLNYSIVNADFSETPSANNKMKVNGTVYPNSWWGDPNPYSGIPLIGARGGEPLLAGNQMAELIVYTGSKAGNPRNAVLSYLAIKYGITLDKAGIGNSYINSAGTTVFNDTNYWNQIVGIAKDSTSGLDQRVSKNINDTIGLTLSTTADFSTSNATARTALADMAYLLMGSNNSATTLGSAWGGRCQWHPF